MSRKLLIGWKSELNVEEIRFGISSRIDLARNMKTAARSLTDNDDSFTTRTPTGVQISASECANLALSARVENVQIIDQKLYTLTHSFGYCRGLQRREAYWLEGLQRREACSIERRTWSGGLQRRDGCSVERRTGLMGCRVATATGSIRLERRE